MRALRRKFLQRDPAPSRIAFRLKRRWRSPAFRRVIMVQVPVAAALIALGGALAQPDIRQAAMDRFETVRGEIVARPEFAIRRIEVRGASPAVAATVRASLQPWIGASSLAADAASIRAAVGALGWVESAGARLVAPETLIVTVKERTPALVWRMGPDLTLLDRNGGRIASLAARAERPDLPLIAGAGADRAAADAQAVLDAAGGLAARIRGLVRVGERRWDVVIEDGPRIMLPAAGAADAMSYVAALEAGERVLSREVSHVDLRLERRPTLRLTAGGVEALEAARNSREPRKAGKDA
ncbi:cell division protein FtsQ/DivIB [Pikeienuella sp. HZG-20]|uniref:cell division protein FtsQ/DivIB n=1 Tax=Paludibacillus litoralis TaxID=3133267 RepID=UPI0030EB381B